MNPSSPVDVCPRCGAPLPEGSGGVCPRCVMAQVMQPTGPEDSATLPAPAAEELAPHFPQLDILECLGRGGMGVVYKARQKTLNRLVALKLLAPERAGDAAFARHFTREAQALAALSHPHIVTIHDFGQAGGYYYLLMEFVDGVNLRQAMTGPRFTPEQALAVVPPVCEALQYAHEHSIVHRDIKPENLLMDKTGRVKIADFGIAKMLGEESDFGLAESQPAGTPQYMAPEQKEYQRADHRADIYSLGVVLYEMLTGELPADKLQPPSQKIQIDVRLDEVVLRALEKTPWLRYQTAAEMRTQVQALATVVLPRAPAPPSPPAPSPPAPAAPHFSRWSIVSAAWIVFFLLIIPAFVVHEIQTQEFWLHGPFGSGPAFVFFFGMFLPALGAPLGATILGWIAAGHIRRSPDRLHGLWLAAFDGLLFPLLALDFLLGWLTVQVAVHQHLWELDIEDLSSRRVIAFMVFASAIVDVLIVRWVWGVMRKPVSAAPATAPPRLSRWSLVSAAWIVFFFIIVPGFIAHEIATQEIWRSGPFGSMEAVLSIFGLVLPAMAAPFGATILGWISAAQIRRSPDRLHGLWLAAFDGLLFPLLALDVLLGWLILQVAINFRLWTLDLNDMSNRRVIAFMVLSSIIVDVVIVRRAWSAMKRPLGSASPPPRSRPRAAALAFSAACLSGLLPTLFFWLAPWAAPWMTTQVQSLMLQLAVFMAVAALVLGIYSRRNAWGLSGLVVGSLNIALWLFFFKTGPTPSLPPSSASPAAASAAPVPAPKPALRVMDWSTVDEPPQLRYLAWQDEWKQAMPPRAWHPDGTAVTDPAEQRTLQAVPPCSMTPSPHLERTPRFLHLWLSHPLFDPSCTVAGGVVILDQQGNRLQAQDTSQCSSFTEATDRTHGQGWITYTLSPGPAFDRRPVVTVRLSYVLGPLEHTHQVTVTPRHHVSVSLEGGSYLDSTGQDVDGNAFLTLAVDATQMVDRRFGVVALTKDGRELTTSPSTYGTAGVQGIRIEQFGFTTPLADVQLFRIGSRPVRTKEWTVQLPP